MIVDVLPPASHSSDSSGDAASTMDGDTAGEFVLFERVISGKTVFWLGFGMANDLVIGSMDAAFGTGMTKLAASSARP